MKEPKRPWNVMLMLLAVACFVLILMSHDCVSVDVDMTSLQKLHSLYLGNLGSKGENISESQVSGSTVGEGSQSADAPQTFRKTREGFVHMRIPPMNRQLDPPPRLQKKYTCMVVVADSIAKSGKYKYPSHLEKILESSGYSGKIITHARPGQGLTDWLATDLIDVLLKTFFENNCTAILIQLGLNDGLRGGSVVNAISLQRMFISEVRKSVPKQTAIVVATLPIVSNDMLPDLWMNEANAGISEIAVINRCIVADLYRSMLDAYKASGETNWHKLLADGVHPTPLGVQVISNSFAAAILHGRDHYSISLFCGERIYWAGYQFMPKWKPDACRTNNRITVSLGNGSALHLDTSVEMTISPSWNSPYARFPQFGKYYIHITSSSGEVTNSKFQSPMGGPEIYWSLPAGTKKIEVSFRKSFPKASNNGNRYLPVLGGGPQPEYPVDPNRDIPIIKKLVENDNRFNPLPE
eukprot:TRINITY_DN21788_c0_g1_i1.p1 TRINITY_DN21788_c0_g1~~TRINITY_DN21788_c0_g1_i1.p1  ORF type:complete len:467 (+),score=71.06 TRINITY_DN21788_c0_g1_i1:123-1523(+)